MKKYADFLGSKDKRHHNVGFEPGETNPQLFPFQADIVRWAARKGRAAIFADCGLGKTPMQLDWANMIDGDTLILAPLAVSYQTKREGEKFGVEVNVCKTDADLKPGINITNYERLHYFEKKKFSGLVLDESSILKGFDGKFRRRVTDFANTIPYRLACTATPAPNDLIELTNHSEFLGGLSGKEIIALFFVQDGNTTHKWRLRKHAVKDFWRWVASWAVAMRKPSDLGYADDGFELPDLNIIETIIGETEPLEGHLFPLAASTLTERRQAKKQTSTHRAQVIADLVNNSSDQWLVWCNLNKESDDLRRLIDGAVEVRGSDDPDDKEAALMSFSRGESRVLVTKPSIAGFGLNWQQCHNMAFSSLSDSYEQYYQAVRRCWRFGQKNEVNCHIVTSELEGNTILNVKRKEADADRMFSEITLEMKPYEEVGVEKRHGKSTPKYRSETGDGWEMMLGDSVEHIKRVRDNSIGLSVFSPPFPGMYAYTDHKEDVGNCSGIDELINHFGFMVPDLLRITMPGRSCCIHLTQMPVFKGRDGHVGLKDFRGRVISLMEENGWLYYGEVTIDKDPQVKASRTKDHSLLFKTLGTDSSDCRMALADYVLQFKKPGENTVPIPSGQHPRWNPDGGWITPDEWIEWAAPVWYRKTPDYPGGIKETDVLNNYRIGRENQDERHICPLQLGVIERAVKLWSAPGDTVFSPFAGIGSEGYVSLGFDRKFIGIELKESYFRVACENLARAKSQMSLSL